MNHPAWQELNDLADGVLGAARAAAVGDHLRVCADCAASVRRIEAVRDAAPALLAERAAPPVGEVLVRIRSARRAAQWRSRAWLATAAVVVLVAVGVWRGWEGESTPPSPVMAGDKAMVEARVAEQLAIIDGAIAELRTLLVTQPANAELRAQLASAERDRELLAAMAVDVVRGAFLNGGM